MITNFIKINDSMIEPLSKIIGEEFLNSPFISYIIGDKDAQSEVLPILFDKSLRLYKKIGVTYVTSIDLEGTFSLVNFHNNILNTDTLFNSIISLFEVSSKINIIETSNKLIKCKDVLIEIKDYMSSKSKYMFLSSIAYIKSKDDLLKNKFLEDMIKAVIAESFEKNIPILVETESLGMVDLYKKFGFKLDNKFTIKDNVIIYFLEFH